MGSKILNFFKQGNPGAKSAALLLAFSPAILLIILITENAVNIPVWDGWERTALFEKVDAGTLTFADLYAPHIDHRMVFPRLLMIGLAYASDGDLRFDVVATFLIGLGAGIGFYKLAVQTVGSAKWTLGLTFLCNLWIFSPLQCDNWLWPIQTSFMIPMTCLIWGIWATIQPWAWWKRWLLAASLAIVGTHSFSHGLFIWPAVGLLAALSLKNFARPRDKWSFVGLWVILAAAIISCYFGIDFKTGTGYGYGREIGSPPPLAASWYVNLTDNLDKSTSFFLSILGNPIKRRFAIDPMHLSHTVGGTILLMFAGFAGALFLKFGKKRDREMWMRALPWLALGATVIAIAFGVSLGRASLLAPARATVPRLLSVAIYLPLSLLVLTVLMVKIRKSWIGPAALGFLIALQIQPWLYGARLMELWRVSRLQAQAQVMFIEHWDPVPSRIAAYQPPAVKRYAPTLNKKNWLDKPLVKSLNLNQFSISENLLPKTKGVMLNAVPLDENSTWEITGTSCVHNPTRPADAVLITMHHEGTKTPKIIGLADSNGTLMPTRYRIDLQFTALEELHTNDPGTWMNWREEISLKNLPSGREITIRAWSFNLEKRKVYPMPNHLKIAKNGAVEFVLN